MTETQARVLLVEDDARLADLVGEYLTENGFVVSFESRGDTAVDRIIDEAPDLVVLDLMLPGLDGLEVCRRVRPQFDGGILMLTARGDEIDEVVGLEVGADDYLPKPVRPRLLLAHLGALLRRVRSAIAADEAAWDAAAPTAEGEGAFKVGPLTIDPRTRNATMRGEALDLTTAEFDLLLLLAKRAGEVLTRDTIYLELRGIEYDGLDRSVDLRVTRLRRKLGDDARNPELLKSVRGVGYLLAWAR
ncbi:MAG: DNA-binding response regulator [Deltaproteobacteria bacterium HGW-Deltaproteobacteria-14]|nr:MAG: DNA-binding response regulator [Deltaproteobacteria bacterium HGW-Deltaproteobacteria-14]